MNALVTGGAGFIGSHMVDKLIELNHSVVVLDDYSTGREENLAQHQNKPQLTIYKKSIADDLNAIFEKHEFDVVFHFAAIAAVQESIHDPLRTNTINVNGTLNLLETSKDHGVMRFVFSSSGGAIYGDTDALPVNEEAKQEPLSPYGLHKLVGEHYGRLFNLLFGMEVVSLRYANVYGPRQNPDGTYACLIPRFISKFERDEIPVINGDGEQTRDFVYVSDVVNANLKASDTMNETVFGEAFNIGSGQELSVNQVSETIRQVGSYDTQPEHGPGVVEVRRSVLDVSKAEKMLGWTPLVSFDEGLRETWEYFKHRS